MSTFDNAIQAHMAHALGTGAGPLTDSLANQTRPRLREGWETEPIDPPHRWGLYLMVAVVTVFVSFCTDGWQVVQ